MQWSLQKYDSTASNVSQASLKREAWLEAVQTLIEPGEAEETAGVRRPEAAATGGPILAARPRGAQELGATPHDGEEVDGAGREHLVLGPGNSAPFKKRTRVHAYEVHSRCVLHKPWGDTTAAPGDYLIVEGVGDMYTCTREAFGEDYAKVHGACVRARVRVCVCAHLRAPYLGTRASAHVLWRAHDFVCESGAVGVSVQCRGGARVSHRCRGR